VIHDLQTSFYEYIIYMITGWEW